MSTTILEQNTVSNDTVIDLLDRQPFINQMLQIAEALSKSKKNACYALNGAWGVGKSYVISKFEKQITQYGQEGTTLSRFLVFHYDCWKYDYYAEPLTAIISVMLETIERDVQLLSEDAKKTIISTLKAIGIYALDHFDRRIERKLGFSPKEIYEAIVNTESEVLSQIEESHEFDSYYAIKATLNRLRESITQLAEHQTILLVVDELDRCLPEYTIKVLERLHHVFVGIPNVQVLLATDKKQLGHVVRQIYGEETSVEKYLEKFIQFELSLATGSINDAFDNRFSAYSTRFAHLIDGISLSDIDSFRRTIFEGVDIRVQISIVERCLLAHDLCANGKMDYSIMCMELLFTLLRYFDYDNGILNDNIKIDSLFELHTSPDCQIPFQMQGLKLLGSFYKVHRRILILTEKNETLINLGNNNYLLYSFILGLYRQVLNVENDYWLHDFQDLTKYIDYAKKFWSLLQVIH